MRKSVIAVLLALVTSISSGAAKPAPKTAVLKPYSGTPVSLPGTIAPETYDLGGEGVAYHDSDSINSGGVFRQDGVDIQSALFGGYDIGWINAGEWLNYTTNVTASDNYVVTIKVASPNGGAFHVGFNGPSLGTWNSVTVPATGGWQNWTSITTNVSLKAGTQQLTLKADTAGFNIGTISVQKVVVAPPPPPQPTTCTDPAATNYGGALPCSYPLSAAGNTISVPAGGDLQAALNNAQEGDTILLAQGATYTGNFVLPAKGNAKYITLATSGLAPAAGEQVIPSMGIGMAKIRSGNSSPALTTAPYAQHYIVDFIEFLGNTGGFNEVISLGDGGPAQNSSAVVPHDLIVKHVWVHGDDAVGQKRGIGLNSASTQILDSRIENIWAPGQDSQGIAGWNGPGPYVIDNNYIEAASENVLFGGSDPALINNIPSDITFTHNYLTKRMAWFGLTDRSIKNIFELKMAQRVRVEGNVFENNWVQAQSGYAIVFTTRNQDGNAPWATVQDVTFVNNIVRHTSNVFNVLGKDDGHTSAQGHNIGISNNLFEDVSGAKYGGAGRLLLISAGVDVRMDHNTTLSDGDSPVYAYGIPTQQFQFTNNIMPGNAYGVMGDGSAPGNNTLATWFPAVNILRNAIAALSTPWTFPAGNFYPSSLSEMGFVNLSGGNYRLAATSIYKNAGTDGKDLGANIDNINAAAKTAY